MYVIPYPLENGRPYCARADRTNSRRRRANWLLLIPEFEQVKTFIDFDDEEEKLGLGGRSASVPPQGPFFGNGRSGLKRMMLCLEVFRV